MRIVVDLGSPSSNSSNGELEVAAPAFLAAYGEVVVERRGQWSGVAKCGARGGFL